MTERLRKILKGGKIDPKTADEAAVKYAIDNASGGGSITVDTEITEGGKNPVTGGAIYTALNAVNDDFVVTITVSMDGGRPTITTETKVTEIIAAARAGKNVYALADTGLYMQKMPLTAYGDGITGDGLVGFGGVIPDAGSTKSSMSSALGSAVISDGVETDTWAIYTE